MKQTLHAVSWILFSVLAANAQAPPDKPEFEVASVKPSTAPLSPMPAKLPFADSIGFNGGPGSDDPGRINYQSVTLKALLARAYNLRSDRISGPGWLETERYDILAKVPQGTDADRLRLMLQKLLTDRFQIALRHETKVSQVYRLTLAKNGPKLQLAEELPAKDETERAAAAQAKAMANMEARQAETRRRKDLGLPALGPSRRFRMARATTDKFAQALTSFLDRPVVDMTQLKGFYTFELNWVPDSTQTRSADDAAPSGPSIFTSVQEQLGLKLESAKEQLDLLVIDSASKVPTSN